MFSFGSIIRSLTDFRRQRQPDRAATNPPNDANAAAPNGMTSSANAQQVELAVRRAIHPGMRLRTPGRGYPPRDRMPFVVTAVDRTGINTNKTMGHYVTWSELAGVAPYLHRLGGSAPIGAHETQPEPGTLGRYLQQLGSLPSPRKAIYLASILETAGVLEYDHNNGGAKRVRLLPPFAPGSGESDSYAEPPAPKDFAPPATPAVSAGRAHHTTEAEIRSDAGLVERAIRQTLVSGHTLLTPGRGDPPQERSPFVVQIDDAGIRTDKTGNHIITWTELEGVVPYLNDRNGTAEIGAVRSTAKPDTLQSYLQQGSIRLSRSSYVAAILEAARVVGYDHNNGKAKRIRLLPPFAPGSGEYDRL